MQGHFACRGQKYFNIALVHSPAGRVTYNFHSSCKHMHMSFKSVCNKEHKGVICNMTSSSISSQSTCPTGQVLWEEFLVLSRFHRNYQRTSEIFVLWHAFFVLSPDDFQNHFSKKNLSGIPSECQTVLTQIRPYVLSV